MTLKIKFADFAQITRARSAASPITTRDGVHACALALLRAEHPMPRGVRLLGVTLSGLFGPDTALTAVPLPFWEAF